MAPIGGYFGLELREGVEYHKDAIRLHSGRQAFEYILRANKYKKVYLPYYSCGVLLEPLVVLGIPYSFYHIDEHLKPVFDFQTIEDDACFLYIDYFGLKSHYVSRLAEFCKNLIIDNTQAFFALPERDVPTFYSCRKFFGVPDGSYLYTNTLLNQFYPISKSSVNNCLHLLQRRDGEVENGYIHFKEMEADLSNQSITRMSALTQRLLQGIDYKGVVKKRRDNFNYLHTFLKQTNKLELGYVGSCVPLSYPYCCENEDVRKYMIKKKIFTPQYWADALHRCHPGDVEYDLIKNVFHIPVDQRYNILDMRYIIDELLHFIQQ
jgi:hypothetical protein